MLVDGQGMKRHVFGKTRIGVRVFRIALLAIRNAEGADRIQTAATLIGTGLEYLKTRFSSRENFRPPPCLAIDASPQIDGWPPFRYRSWAWLTDNVDPRNQKSALGDEPGEASRGVCAPAETEIEDFIALAMGVHQPFVAANHGLIQSPSEDAGAPTNDARKVRP